MDLFGRLNHPSRVAVADSRERPLFLTTGPVRFAEAETRLLMTEKHCFDKKKQAKKKNYKKNEQDHCCKNQPSPAVQYSARVYFQKVGI